MDGKTMETLQPILLHRKLLLSFKKIYRNSDIRDISTMYLHPHTMKIKEQKSQKSKHCSASLHSWYIAHVYTAVLLWHTFSIVQDTDLQYAMLQCMTERCCTKFIFILLTFQLLEHFLLINFQNTVIYSKQTECFSSWKECDNTSKKILLGCSSSDNSCLEPIQGANL